MAKEQFIRTAKWAKAFKESTEGKQLIAVAIAIFRHHLMGGMRDKWQARAPGGSWAPLKENTERWKRWKGRSMEPWKNTGKTLKAIEQNVPTKIGTKRGIRFGINFRNMRAFIFPNTIKRPGLRIKQKRNIFRRLNRLRPWFVWDKATDDPPTRRNVERQMRLNARKKGLKT